MNGAEALVAALRATGVRVVFGLPGVHNLAAWEALAHSDIRLIGVRHEQAAVYAADGFARATGRLGVAITTTGPGAANTLGATGEAWASRSPVLVIATDIPSTLRRPGVYRGALHETPDQAGMFAPVTKRRITVGSTARLAADVVRAAASAMAHPRRPVYLQVPTDLLAAPAPGPVPRTDVAPAALDLSALDAAVALLAGADRPLIWAGGGATASDAGTAVGQIADRLAAPVVTTYQARGLLPPDHDLLVGLPPQLPECGQLWDRADVVLAIGTDFDAMMTQNWRQPAPPALVTVNIDAVDAAKAYPPDAALTGDAAAVLTPLLAALPERGARAGVAADLAVRRRSAVARLRGEEPAAFQLLDQLARILPDDATVVADMCIPGYWYAAFGRVAGPRRLAYPVGWGTLGFAFPAAMGSAVAHALGDSGPALCITGDGGFLFNAGELATVAGEQLPLTVLLVDDGGYGMLRYDQKRAGQQCFGVDLHTPDFVALAESFGIRSAQVTGFGEDFAATLTAHLDDPRPTMLVARAALEPPPTTSPRWYRAH